MSKKRSSCYPDMPIHYAEMVLNKQAVCGKIITPILSSTKIVKEVTCKVCKKYLRTQ